MEFGTKDKLVVGATAGAVSAKIAEGLSLNIGAGVVVEVLKK